MTEKEGQDAEEIEEEFEEEQSEEAPEEMEETTEEEDEETKIIDLPGVGEKTYEKFVENGYDDMMSIAASSSSELSEKCDIGQATAVKIIQAARDALEMGFETAADVRERRKQVGQITTGSKQLDELIGGGVETQSITEAHGAFGSAKSQLAFQLCVNVQLPKERGGLDKGAILLDTEGTFRPDRITQMAEYADLDPDEVLERLHVARAYNSDHQILLAEKLGEIIKKNDIGLVVVDSLMAQFRSDYTGRGTLANRQQKLNKHLHVLQKIADVHNVAVYVTNQVMAKPDVLFGDPTSPIGGHILGHQATFRLYLRKSKGAKRVVKLIDSPSLPEGEAVFKVTNEGIRDA